MTPRLARALIILPGTVAIFIPGALLWIFHHPAWTAALSSPDSPAWWTGLICITAGSALGL